ncbi:MAG: hypothetical protein KC478_09810 [Bacteriovoracaceae bacterium]|nr:hypothetical protein [Bacteriovoracaceae bacterium]
MKHFFVYLILTTSVLAQIPRELPSQTNINSILFREMKSYMFQVLQKSQVFKLSNECQLIKFNNLSVPNSRKSLKFCLSSQISQDKVKQTLRVHSANQFAGSFQLIRTGEDLKPISLQQFLSFNLPENKLGEKLEFYFDYFSFAIINDLRDLPFKFDSFLQIKGFHINIYEDQQNSVRFRNYLLTCDDCNGVPVLKVQVDKQNIRYYTGMDIGEVTPAHFNQMVANFIVIPFTQLGLQLKDKLIDELNWPKI